MEIRPTATKTPNAEANIILKNCFISVSRYFYQTANIVNLLILIVVFRLFIWPSDNILTKNGAEYQGVVNFLCEV